MRNVALSLPRSARPGTGTGTARVDTAQLSRLNGPSPPIATPTAMHRSIARALLPLVAAALAASATTAQAAICFVIHDAKDTVVYRDWVAPFDGALDYASPGREALRQRDLHFSYFDAPVCQPVSMTATGAPKVASVEAIVASIPNSRPTARGITTTTEPGGGFASSNSGVIVVPGGGVGSGVVERARAAGATAGARPVAYR